MNEEASDASVGAIETASESGARGGRARAERMTPEQRSEGARLAALSRWAGEPLPNSLKDGTLQLGEFSAPCYVLDEPGPQPRRLLSQGGTIALVGMSRGSNPKLGSSDRLANFVAGKAISPFISEDLAAAIRNPIRFRRGEALMSGYEATVLTKLCKAVLRFQREGRPHPQVAPIILRCAILQEAFAEVGINGLIDEATGYQDIRPHNALAKILEAYIAKELRPYVSRFPPEFYKEMFRLNTWNYPQDGKLKRRPMLAGLYTSNLIYSRLAPGVQEELKRTTPRYDSGGLKHHYHRKLTEEVGHPKLKEHLAVVTAFMRAAPDWKSFIQMLDKALPRFGKTYEMPLE